MTEWLLQKNTAIRQLVTAYIQKPDTVPAEVMEAVRKIILSTEIVIGKQIKWNTPSFIFTGPMKPFNPKELIRDIVVFNIYKVYALLVFPTGAQVNIRQGLLESDYTDRGRPANFYNMENVDTKKEALKNVIMDWLKLIDLY